MKDEFITIRKVKEMLRVSTTTLHKWEKMGILKPHHRRMPRGDRMYRKEDIRKFIDSLPIY